MFQLGQLAGRGLSIEHRHSDGSWSELEPVRKHHDAADHDPERQWEYGQVFKCPACEEEVRVVLDPREHKEGGPE
jgi:hypothetical protein